MSFFSSRFFYDAMYRIGAPWEGDARKAQRKLGPRSRSVRFVRADLTAASLGGAEGEYDVLVDYGTLDDLTGAARIAMARTIHRISRPRSRFLLWCFYGRADELPRISFTGPSRLTPVIAPGDVERLFGASFKIERLPEPGPASRAACFLMTRIAGDGAYVTKVAG